MKDQLAEKLRRYQRLAQELEQSEAYQEILKKSTEKRELLLKEAMVSDTISELRYKVGFIHGLEFFDQAIAQWKQRAKRLRKN